MTATELKLNKLLLKQLQKRVGDVNELPPEMMEFLNVVSQTYDQYERERQLIERSIDISSQEMLEANGKLEKQAEKLRRSNEELREFAFAVSHDLKEPLRTIASYIQLTESRLKTKLDDETREFMGYSVAGVKRLQTMLDAMLKYAQVGEDRQDFGRINLFDVIKTVNENLHESIAMSGAKIQANSLPVIIGNRIQLVQLFQNLIANSIKFHGAEKPFIQIETDDRGSEYIVSVSDNGIGISDENKQKYFVMFRRGHSRDYEGIGMGLSICKKIVENHGGAIWIDENVKQGLKVCFSLPKN